MAELLAGVTIPRILSGALSALQTAYNLYDMTKARREQVKIMLSRCEDLIRQTAIRTQGLKHADLSEDIIQGAAHVQSACESVRGLIEKVNNKGFVWCLLNVDKIDAQVQISKEQIQEAFTVFQFHAVFDVATFQADLIRAQIQDKEDLSAMLYRLAENDRQILDAIQDQSGVYKRLEDLLIGVYKHVQHITIADEATPENQFLRTAAGALGRKYNIGTDRKFAAYILSSFEVEEIRDSVIGSGASGQVLTGEWKGSVIAIKRMHIQDARVINDKDRRTLRHEVKIWATLHHENILPLYGACPDADVPFLVMKYCPEGDVRRYLQNNPLGDRLRLSCDVAVGLAFLHSKSIIHADVKGANVLVNGEHRALLTDFGLSIVMNDIRSRSTYSKELQDKARGTMAWMAPEVHYGSQPDQAADVYSLGMTIWEIFSNQNPFNGTRIESLSEIVRRGTRPSHIPAFPVGHKAWDIVQDCWANDPRSRPESSEVMTRLKSVIKADDISNGTAPAPAKVDASFFGDSTTTELLSKVSRVTGRQEMSLNLPPSNLIRLEGGSKAGSQINSSQSLSTINKSGAVGSTVSRPDPEDPIWTSIVQAFPPQWKYVSWGGRHFIDGVTLPFVLIDKSYRYRVFTGTSDLGIKDTYELSADGSQRINFLEYNRGYGISDSAHVKVFVVDPDGKEALVAHWNPRDKPLTNVESEYAKQVRAGGVQWTLSNNSSVLSVSLKQVLNDKDYSFRVMRDGTDLGVRPAGHIKADKTCVVNLTKYNDGQGIPIHSLIKVFVVDTDVSGRGELVAGWWQPPGVDPSSLFHPLLPSKVDNSISSSTLTAVTAPSSLPSLYSAPSKASYTPILSNTSSSPSASFTPPLSNVLPPSAPMESEPVVHPAKKKHFWSRWR